MLASMHVGIVEGYGISGNISWDQVFVTRIVRIIYAGLGGIRVLRIR